MNAYEVIAARAQELDISNAELARRMKMSPELIRRSLSGIRKITADELITFSLILGLDLNDFKKAKFAKK